VPELSPAYRTIRDNAQNAFHSLWTRKPAASDRKWITDLYQLSQRWQCSGQFGGSLTGCNFSALDRRKVEQMIANLRRVGGRDAADANAIYAYFNMNRDLIKDGIASLAPPAVKPGEIDRGNVTPAQVGEAAKETLGGTFLGPLFQANLWIRVGEVVLGLILIAVGVVRLAPTSQLVNKTPVGRIAKAIR
jgi:hypothetical protein